MQLASIKSPFSSFVTCFLLIAFSYSLLITLKHQVFLIVVLSSLINSQIALPKTCNQSDIYSIVALFTKLSTQLLFNKAPIVECFNDLSYFVFLFEIIRLPTTQFAFSTAIFHVLVC